MALQTSYNLNKCISINLCLSILFMLPIFLFSQITNNNVIFRTDSNAIVSFQQDFTNTSDATLDHRGSIYTSKNWKNDGTINEWKSSINFTSATDTQIIEGNTNSSFYDFIVNNKNLLIKTNVEIKNSLKFENGIINSTDSSMLILFDDATTTGASDSSHTKGPIEKRGNDAFTFPVGNGTYYRPISITAPSSPINAVGKYIRAAPSDQSTLESGINHISEVEYWSVTNISGVYINLSWNDSSAVQDPTSLLVAHWTGSEWENLGNGSTTGNSSNGTVTSSIVTPSNELFTLGSSSGLNPLPVEMLYFNVTANLLANNVKIDWATATEINSSHFEIERSLDALNWEKIGTQKAAGNSNDLNTYLSFDNNPLNGLSYYRLKQVDYDGAFEYSEIRSVKFDKNLANNYVIYPNPTTDKIWLKGLNEKNISVVKIYNLIGKLVKKVNFKDNQATHEIEIKGLTNGLYYLDFMDKSGNSIWKTEVIKSE